MIASSSKTSKAKQVGKRGINPRRVIDYAVLVFFTVVLLTPLVWLVLASFKSKGSVMIDTGLFPKEFSVQGWLDALTKPTLASVFLNSFIISSLSTLSVLLVASLAAYPLALSFGANDF
jgi:ABC-type glycerol-3-phosphate transport system permease component